MQVQLFQNGGDNAVLLNEITHRESEVDVLGSQKPLTIEEIFKSKKLEQRLRGEAKDYIFLRKVSGSCSAIRPNDIVHCGDLITFIPRTEFVFKAYRNFFHFHKNMTLDQVRELLEQGKTQEEHLEDLKAKHISELGEIMEESQEQSTLDFTKSPTMLSTQHE